jgi:hypothetical protein
VTLWGYPPDVSSKSTRCRNPDNHKQNCKRRGNLRSRAAISEQTTGLINAIKKAIEQRGSFRLQNTSYRINVTYTLQWNNKKVKSSDLIIIEITCDIASVCHISRTLDLTAELHCFTYQSNQPCTTLFSAGFWIRLTINSSVLPLTRKRTHCAVLNHKPVPADTTPVVTCGKHQTHLSFLVTVVKHVRSLKRLIWSWHYQSWFVDW